MRRQKTISRTYYLFPHETPFIKLIQLRINFISSGVVEINRLWGVKNITTTYLIPRKFSNLLIVFNNVCNSAGLLPRKFGACRQCGDKNATTTSQNATTTAAKRHDNTAKRHDNFTKTPRQLHKTPTTSQNATTTSQNAATTSQNATTTSAKRHDNFTKRHDNFHKTPRQLHKNATTTSQNALAQSDNYQD